MKLVRLSLLSIIILLLCSEAVLAKIVLSAPPREKSAAGEKYYGPIAKELSKILNEQVVYKHPKNWIEFTKDMRANKYDIVFDGPHFASWRMEHVGHVPVARLSGNLQFYMLAKKSDKKLAKMQDLLGKSFCGLASPNLGTMSAFNIYKNPIVQPSIQIVKGGMKNVMKKFLAGECRAAVVRDKIYKKLPPEKKKLIRIIAKSKKMPNQSFTASKRLSAEERKKITQFLTSKKGAKASDALLSRFSKKKKFWITPKKGEFADLNFLLEGVVYGWL
ncbi:MAG: phosphate/phosphite/phosphonate ABC transporter substrate-binding protein [Thiohalomonadales bacterium]